ncbi:TIM barrel protein [Halomonas sp. V046]|uniref:TIM barrel protein n=1 Tax=Halomonas sp. V046 TaxID=3459611 RepID=UPI004044B639
MTHSPIRFALNHMVCPRFSIDELMQAAAELGLGGVELRSDIGAHSLTHVDQALAARQRAQELGIEVLSLNALYPFNLWNDERHREAERLAELTAAAGGQGLVLCPWVDGDGDSPDSDLETALLVLDEILGRHGLKGFVEPLGFVASSLRFKRDAVAAIDAVGLAQRFSLVHDTFHHQGAGEVELFAARTGLVHVSGVEDPELCFAAMQDGDRLLVGEADRLDNVGQLRRLIEGGYRGDVSFEPFAEKVHALADPLAALEQSLAFLRERLAA